MRKFTDLWPRIAPLLNNVERPSRYINHEWGAVYSASAVSTADAESFGDVTGATGVAGVVGAGADADVASAAGCGAEDELAFCMVYPDTYELGQPNQAVRILVNAVNATPGLWAERAYLPAVDMIDAMRAEQVPLFSLESCAPLSEFDVVGITLPHELAATNVLEVLGLAGIPVLAADRTEGDPIVIAGGPCAYNPEPYAQFFDAFTIGEGEEATPETLLRIRELKASGASREQILRELAHVPGTYVPSLYDVLDENQAQETGSWLEPKFEDVPRLIEKRVFEGFAESDAWEPCIVPFTEAVHDRLNVEVLRGCARGCRFCQAGMMYRPVRERSADNIVNAVKRGLAETGYEEVSLTSLSTTDHSQIEEILTRLNREYEGTGVRISIPSQRLDSFGVNMAGLVAGQKKGGLTFAPEAGTQRLRDVVNKNVHEEDLFSAIDASMAAGWRRVKLYFMIGLPTETDDDVKGIASLAQRAYDRMKAAVDVEQRGRLRMSVSVALFVPKSQTPFQWDGQISSEEALRRVKLLKNSVKYRAIDVRYHDPSTSFVEAVMSRGGRIAGEWVHAAWKRGARFDAWSELFNEEAWRAAAEDVGLNPEAIAQTTYEPGHVMPWAHISCGVTERFLAKERERAEAGITTEDCTFANCSVCGVCMGLGVQNELAGGR